MCFIVQEGSKYSLLGRGKAAVVWGYFVNEGGLILEVMVQGEGALGRQTKRGTGVLQKKIEYEHKGRVIKAYLGGSEQRGGQVSAGDEVGHVNRRLWRLFVISTGGEWGNRISW